LRLLAAVLAGAALATTMGGVVIGRWASARLVRPFASVAAVAGAISQGALDQRLPADRDANLAPLVASFNGMVDALSRRIERDVRFASDVSHELRSPLTTLQASVEVLAAFRSSLPIEGRKALELLRCETSRFSEMVQDLLEIARIDGGAAPLELEELPLDEVITRTVGAFSAVHIPVDVQPGARGASILADRRRLQRVIANLLDNAGKYGGGATLVSVDCTAGWVRVCIDAAGPGVPASERDRIFERFYRGLAAGRRAAGRRIGNGSRSRLGVRARGRPSRPDLGGGGPGRGGPLLPRVPRGWAMRRRPSGAGGASWSAWESSPAAGSVPSPPLRPSTPTACPSGS